MNPPVNSSMNPPNTPARDTGSTAAQSAEARQVAMELSRWWWAWLVTGTIWTLAAIVVLQFRDASVTIVGIIIGIMFLGAGIQEFVTAAVSSGWRWLWVILGAVLFVGGIYALFNPVKTTLAVADTLGFVFALVGIFWIIEAFATAEANPIWWLGLISGAIMIILAFWAGGQLLGTQVYTLLIFTGLWALLHGISDIFKAFRIKGLGGMVAA